MCVSIFKFYFLLTATSRLLSRWHWNRNKHKTWLDFFYFLLSLFFFRHSFTVYLHIQRFCRRKNARKSGFDFRLAVSTSFRFLHLMTTPSSSVGNIDLLTFCAFLLIFLFQLLFHMFSFSCFFLSLFVENWDLRLCHVLKESFDSLEVKNRMRS